MPSAFSLVMYGTVCCLTSSQRHHCPSVSSNWSRSYWDACRTATIDLCTSHCSVSLNWVLWKFSSTYIISITLSYNSNNSKKICPQTAQTPLAGCSVALLWVTIYHIKCPPPNVKQSEKLIHIQMRINTKILSLSQCHPSPTPTVSGRQP